MPADRPARAPLRRFWAELGLVPREELAGGYQSRVFLTDGRLGQVVVKVREVGPDGDLDRMRLEFVNRLAAVDPAVVGPVDVGPDIAVDVDGWRAVCYPFIEGARPDTDRRSHVEEMANALAGLHSSLASQPPVSLPPVAALQGMPSDGLIRDQLIHGDYAAANLIRTSNGLRIIDFDDCGQGAIEYEIGNSLYMALFDAWQTGRRDIYHRFRPWFVDAYRSASGTAIEDALLSAAMRSRRDALGRWLTDPAGAPMGIRTASTDWRRRLHQFVASPLPEWSA